ncbi:scaffolding protein [Microbacterium phage Triscuit]|nr:scaffolding protein [Microbacterium phage Triscuit]
MLDDEKFWNLFPGVILGAEGESEDSENESEEEEEEEEEEDSNSDADADKDKGKDPEKDIAALQKALNAERRLAKKLDRENRKLKAGKTEESEQEQADLETERNRSREATQKAEKLAAGLLQRDLNAAIEKAARAAGFLDPDDAIAGVDRTKIDFDQDDEDPTDIDIDEDTVKAAVKALATKKPHYLTRGTEDGDATGSPFGGSRKKGKKTDADTYRELYPSL